MTSRATTNSSRIVESLRFSLVDVFAETPLTGNPLAVVPDADNVDDDVMRAIAREFNLSETTFVLASTREDVAWRLRSFTPAGVEVGGAGHNALGAWWWLATAGRVALGDRGNRYTQEIGGRVLPVEVVAEGGRPRAISMEQDSPRWGDLARDRAELAASLGLVGGELGGDLPAQVVSTGAAHLLVQARNRVAVDRAVPDGPRLAAVLRAVGGEGCYLYSLDPVDPGSAAYARFFNPTAGISEDPATGTAAGPLASHLVAHDIVADSSTILVEQGHRIGRPSRIEISVLGESVSIAAACVIVAEGTLLC
jgi:trans-2,3-dihydro-3-hydroxyanthranilate isomerase